MRRVSRRGAGGRARLLAAALGLRGGHPSSSASGRVQFAPTPRAWSAAEFAPSVPRAKGQAKGHGRQNTAGGFAPTPRACRRVDSRRCRAREGTGAAHHWARERAPGAREGMDAARERAGDSRQRRAHAGAQKGTNAAPARATRHTDAARVGARIRAMEPARAGARKGRGRRARAGARKGANPRTKGARGFAPMTRDEGRVAAQLVVRAGLVVRASWPDGRDQRRRAPRGERWGSWRASRRAGRRHVGLGPRGEAMGPRGETPGQIRRRAPRGERPGKPDAGHRRRGPRGEHPGRTRQTLGSWCWGSWPVS